MTKAMEAKMKKLMDENKKLKAMMKKKRKNTAEASC